MENRYEKYKDSGIAWIGEIPEHWEITFFKRRITINNGKDYKDFLDAEIYPVMGSGGCFAYCSKYIYDGEAILLGRKGTIDKPLYVNEKFWVVDTMFYAIPHKDLYGKFAYYLALLFPFNLYSTATSLPSLTQTDLGNILVSFPLISEQQSIATYLDQKCNEIDELIALQEEMITKLQSYKQSIITEAVTKGLDKNVPLKDSGIEWIGKIPEHWTLKRIKNICDNLDYLREPISAEHRSRNNPIYDYYGASGVIDKIDYYNVDDQVLLIGEDGANLVMRNLPLVYKAKGKFWVNNHAHILKPKDNNYDFCAYAFEAADYSLFITGSAQPKLSQENLGRIKIAIPPIHEQQTIADYLDQKCSEIDELISIKQQKIEKLKDYKKSLIFECVTGKRKV